MARHEGQFHTAMARYDQAMANYENNGYLLFQALAVELAGRYCNDQGRKNPSVDFLLEAQQLYTLWGAMDKADRLQVEIAQIHMSPCPVLSSEQRSRLELLQETTSEVQRDTLDFTALLASTLAISREMDPNALLLKIMDQILRSAGAQLGYLIWGAPEALRVKARSRFGDEADEHCLQTELVDRPLINMDLPAGLIHYTCRTQEPVILNYPAESGSYVRDAYFRKTNPASALCFPILNRGVLQGAMYLENRLTANIFNPAKLDILRVLCAQAAASMDNAQLYHDTQSANRMLEQKIRESHLAEKHIRQLSQKLLRTQEDERLRISRELHDTVAQNILFISMQCEAAQHKLQNGAPGDLELDKLVRLSQETLATVRGLCLDLRPPSLDQLGLPGAIQQLCRTTIEQDGIYAQFRCPNPPDKRREPETEINLYRIVQEAFHNIRKHAQATRIEVTLDFQKSFLMLKINDNGVGCQLVPASGDTVPPKSLGLQGMEERANLLGGTFRLTSEPGKGTTISVTIPFRRN